MTLDADPYRTLGLAADASLGDIRRAYRRLAKVHHPDAAGETALPRFLAIQAAYEQLIGGLDPPGGGRRASPSPSRPWQADPDRTDATRRAYGGRTGRRRRSEPGGGQGDRPNDPSPGATDGPRRKATLGSTSYDGADVGPFEPDWGGASWYGTTSGTYWTLNPKEYADPRKHGPEYQARARRTSRTGGSATSAPTTAPEAAADPPAAANPPAAADPAPDPASAPTHTTSSWWESTAGPGPAGQGPAGPTMPDAGAAADPFGGRRPRPVAPLPTAPVTDPPPPDLGRAAADIGRALTDERVGGTRSRVARALVGWLPIALGIGWIVGESTGCGRFAATCDGMADPFVILAQAAVLAVLLLIPTLASVAAAASITWLGAAVVAALILSATGGAAGGDSRQSALGTVLLVAWLIGVVIAVVHRVRAFSTPTRPVS